MFTDIDPLKVIVALTLYLAAIVFLLMISILIYKWIIAKKEEHWEIFRSVWEGKLFEYMMGDKDSKELLAELQNSEIQHFMRLIQDFLQNTSGDEFKKLQKILMEYKIHEHLNKLLHKKGNSRILTARVIGMARLKSFLEPIAKLIHTASIQEAYAFAYVYARNNAIIPFSDYMNNEHFTQYLTKDQLLNLLLEFDKSVCPYLLKKLKTETSALKISSYIALLGHHEFVSAEKEIIRIMTNTNEKSVIIASLRALGEIPHLSNPLIFRSYLYFPDKDIQSEAIIAATKLDEPKYEGDFRTKMLDSNWRVIYLSAHALYMCSYTGRKTIERIASDEDAESRLGAISRIVLNQIRL